MNLNNAFSSVTILPSYNLKCLCADAYYCTLPVYYKASNFCYNLRSLSTSANTPSILINKSSNSRLFKLPAAVCDQSIHHTRALPLNSDTANLACSFGLDKPIDPQYSLTLNFQTNKSYTRPSNLPGFSNFTLFYRIVACGWCGGGGAGCTGYYYA